MVKIKLKRGMRLPNRIIKESICYSDDLDKLTPFAETVFYRLLVNVDDYGRIDARPNFLKSKLFMTKQGVTEKAITEAVAQMACIDIVRTYEVSGRGYLYFPKWQLHQRIRESKEKYPAPPLNDSVLEVSPQLAATCGEPPPESNPNPNPNPNPESESKILRGADAPRRSADSQPERQSARAVITLPLNDNTEYPITEEQCQEWAGLYPAVDVIQQLRNMRGWLLANPTKRKTKRGIMRFVTGWLGREQDKGWKGNNAANPSPTGNAFFDMLQTKEDTDGYKPNHDVVRDYK